MAKRVKVNGRVSWFGGPNDGMDSGRTAGGQTTAVPGVAIVGRWGRAAQETFLPQLGTGGNAKIESAREYAQGKGKAKPKTKVKKSTNEFLSGGSSTNEFLP